MNEFLEGLTGLATGMLDFFYYKSMFWIAWWFLMAMFQKKFLYKEALMLAAVGTVAYLLVGWLWGWIADLTLHSKDAWVITMFPWMGGLLVAALAIRFEFITFLGLSEGMWSFKRPRYRAFFAKSPYVTRDEYHTEKKKKKWWRASRSSGDSLLSCKADCMNDDYRRQYNIT